MNNYYSKKGKFLGRAWSVMKCGSREDHKPHVHNPQHTLYGPYMCEGLPGKKLYTTKKREPVN